MIDVNHDGRVDVPEMMAYMNPRNPLHAKAEVSDRRRRRAVKCVCAAQVRELIDMCDANADGRISIYELKAHKDMLYNSPVLQPVRRMHEDL